MKLNLKKTDYIVISILAIIIIAGIIGVVLAVNLMGENNEKDREKRRSEMTNTEENETTMNSAIDPNATPEQQVQQLVNSIPNALQTQNKENALKRIVIKYAYGYDVDLAEEQEFIDVLSIDCIDEDLTSLRELIVKNELSVHESTIPTAATRYNNTKIVINGNEILKFSDKNATYEHDNRTTYVILNDDLLKKVSEIINREAADHVSGIGVEGVKSVTITNSNNATVTITDEEDIKNISLLSSCVELKGNADLSKEKIVYTVDFKNGVKMKVTSGGATAYVEDNTGKTQVKLMFNGETGLESIFKKYTK